MTYDEICIVVDNWFDNFKQPARQLKNFPDIKKAMFDYLKTLNIVESDFKDNSELYWFFKNRRTSFPVCPITGKRTAYKDHGVYCQYCGNVGSKDPAYIAKRKQNLVNKYGVECSLNTVEAKEKTKQTNLQKYGIEDYNHSPEARCKAKNTMIERYGVPHALLSSKIVQKRKQTNLQKYGVDEIGKSVAIQQKARKTCKEKFGTEYAIQNDDIKTKYAQSCLERYGYDSPFKNPNLIHARVLKLKNKTYDDMLSYNKYVQVITTREEWVASKDNIVTWRDVKTGEIFSAYYNYAMPKILNRTDIELFVENILKQHNIQYEHRKHGILGKLEIDFYIPSLKLGIEVGGVYWHSDAIPRITSHYHLNKYRLAQECNIKLLQVFSDEIAEKPQIVANRIKNALHVQKYKIYARKCEIKEISADIKGKFLNKYHIQGNDSSSIRLGAFYHNHLIAVMTFGKERKTIGGKPAEGKYELYRFCTVNNFRCIGIASKLLTYFERNYTPIALKTYADLRWGTGSVYTQLGFTHTHDSKPNYWYVKSGKRHNRVNFQKHKLSKILPKFDENLSETENMKINGYLRIWDCGNAVFEKHYS